MGDQNGENVSHDSITQYTERVLALLYDHYKDSYAYYQATLDKRNRYTIVTILISGGISFLQYLPQTAKELASQGMEQAWGITGWISQN